MAEDNVTNSANSELVVADGEQNSQVQNGTNQNNQVIYTSCFINENNRCTNNIV